MEMFKNLNELKELTDKVILQTLELVEEDVTLKINLERLTNEGALLMAKTRFAQGQNSVSKAQLPAEDSRDFNALKTVARSDRDRPVEFELESHKIDKESNHVEPINWFGILVPQSLKTARDRYDKSIEIVVEIANVEQKLKQNCQLLKKLRAIKVDFEDTEE